MDYKKAGGGALIVGALSFVALMAVHPSHSGGPPLIGAVSLSTIVHGTAFAMQPVLLYGFWVLTRAMGSSPLAQTAFSFYALCAVCTLLAATMSALVLPTIIEAAHIPQPRSPLHDHESLQLLADYTVWLNRALAKVHFTMFSVAIVLWSVAWPSRAPLALLTRAVGALVGCGVLAWAFSGAMTLEARQGALVVTVVQMGWTVLAALTVLRTRTAE